MDDQFLFTADELRRVPSVMDGISRNDVDRHRHNAYIFIETVRKSLSLEKQRTVTSTAMTLFNRFYAYQSLSDIHWRPVCYACLFIALKAEELTVRMESLLKWVYHIKQKLEKVPNVVKLDKDSKEYFLLKEQLEVHERIVLQTTGFELNIKSCTTEMKACMSKVIKEELITTSVVKPAAKVAWEWAHASYGTDLCLRYPPIALACAFLEASCRTYHPKVEIKAWNDQPWWAMFDLDGELSLSEGLFFDIMFRFFQYCRMYKEPRDQSIARPQDPNIYFTRPRTQIQPGALSQPATPNAMSPAYSRATSVAPSPGASTAGPGNSTSTAPSPGPPGSSSASGHTLTVPGTTGAQSRSFPLAGAPAAASSRLATPATQTSSRLGQTAVSASQLTARLTTVQQHQHAMSSSETSLTVASSSISATHLATSQSSAMPGGSSFQAEANRHPSSMQPRQIDTSELHDSNTPSSSA